MYKKIGIVALITALAALVSPAVSPANHLSPGQFKNASKFCKALRAEMGETDFAQAFGTNKNKRNAFGKCVSKKGVLPEPAVPPVTPCQPVEPPLPVHAFVVEPPCVEPPLPVSAFGTEPASPGDQGKNKPKKTNKA